MGLIIGIIVGGIAGWLAGQIMGSRFSILGNIIVGYRCGHRRMYLYSCNAPDQVAAAGSQSGPEN